MEFIKTNINGAFEVILDPFMDERGRFTRLFCKDEFKKINHAKEFVQMNLSSTKNKGTLRGMHFQLEPEAEIKLIGCIRGKVFDVVVDLRKNSDSYLKWIAIELSKEKMNMIYIPEGCAHGFQALEDDCEMIYNHTAMYSPKFERNFSYKDQSVHIDWPLKVTNISDRDSCAPELKMIMEI